jgi:hypothetical protein
MLKDGFVFCCAAGSISPAEEEGASLAKIFEVQQYDYLILPS